MVIDKNARTIYVSGGRLVCAHGINSRAGLNAVGDLTGRTAELPPLPQRRVAESTARLRRQRVDEGK